MRLFKLILSAALLAIVFLGNLAMAKDYKFFRVDLGNEWTEVLPEIEIEEGVYTLAFMSLKDPTINVVVSSTQLEEGVLDQDEFEKKVDTMVNDMAENGIIINKRRYIGNTDYFLLEGKTNNMPLAICLFHKADMMFNFMIVHQSKSKVKQGIKIVDRVHLKS